jgi:hypothetical protein
MAAGGRDAEAIVAEATDAVARLVRDPPAGYPYRERGATPWQLTITTPATALTGATTAP